jgi:hypothetical protein
MEESICEIQINGYKIRSNNRGTKTRKIKKIEITRK